MMRSTYSQKAYPFDRPVALSFTKLKALSSPNDASSSLTCGGKRRIKQTLVTSMKLSCAEVNTATCSQSYLPGMQCVNYCHLIALMLPTETKFKVKKKTFSFCHKECATLQLSFEWSYFRILPIETSYLL